MTSNRPSLLRQWRFVLFGTSVSGKHAVGGGHIASLVPVIMAILAVAATVTVIVVVPLVRHCQGGVP
jgi:hypothetical protein